MMMMMIMMTKTKDWFGMQQERVRREKHTRFWWGNLKERLFGRPRCRWDENCEADLKEVGGDCVNCINLPQDGVKLQNLVNKQMMHI